MHVSHLHAFTVQFVLIDGHKTPPCLPLNKTLAAQIRELSWPRDDFILIAHRVVHMLKGLEAQIGELSWPRDDSILIAHRVVHMWKGLEAQIGELSWLTDDSILIDHRVVHMLKGLEVQMYYSLSNVPPVN